MAWRIARWLLAEGGPGSVDVDPAHPVARRIAVLSEPGLFLPVTEAGAQDETFWNDPLVVKYRSQVEQMVANAENGRLFGFTGGNTFPSISAISAQNLLAQTLQLVVIDGMPAAEAVAEGQALMEEAIAE